MCSGSETGSYLRLMDFVYHSTLGLRVIKKKDGTGPLGGRLSVWVLRLPSEEGTT